jgi:predicted Zn-dependent protease
MGVSGGFRFLRVNIYPGASGERLLALIAHELQHALEVLSDESVTSLAGVQELYQRIGAKRREADNFETEAAQRVQDRVYREARAQTRHR